MSSHRYLIVATALAAHFGCATTQTGRTQLRLVSDQQMNQMGAEAYSEMKAGAKLANQQNVVDYVQCVAGAVVLVTKDPSGVTQWEVDVFDDPTPNAFALPGGKIGVHTGMLKIAETPGQLAAVLGHEVGHVIARHGNERISQTLAVQGGLTVVSAALGGQGTAHDTAMAALGLGAVVGVLMPYGRAQESEGDVIGLELMARAGFDPAEAVQLWKNMSAASQGQPPEFLSTHPSHQTRIHDLTQGQARARTLYQQAKSAGRNPNCIAPAPVVPTLAPTPKPVPATN